MPNPHPTCREHRCLANVNGRCAKERCYGFVRNYGQPQTTYKIARKLYDQVRTMFVKAED